MKRAIRRQSALQRSRAHSITSSARARKDSEIVSPIALAVLRMTTCSKRVGCSTGILRVWFRAAHGDPPRRDRRARQMACSGPAGLDGLLCCADERLSDLSIPPSHDRTLAQSSHAPRPAAPIDVDSNEDDRGPVPAVSTYPASVAREAVPRHHPRWEPGALAAPAGICAGGGEKSPSLPRPPPPARQCNESGCC